MDVTRELALLSDREAEECLNRILSSVQATNPEIPVTSPDKLGNILRAAATAADVAPVEAKTDADLRDAAKAMRLVLMEFCDDRTLKPQLEAALAANRRVLVDPITAALVMAGIVIVLRTRFKFNYIRTNDGKEILEIGLIKHESGEETIKKFFDLF